MTLFKPLLIICSLGLSGAVLATGRLRHDLLAGGRRQGERQYAHQGDLRCRTRAERRSRSPVCRWRRRPGPAPAEGHHHRRHAQGRPALRSASKSSIRLIPRSAWKSASKSRPGKADLGGTQLETAPGVDVQNLGYALTQVVHNLGTVGSPGEQPRRAASTSPSRRPRKGRWRHWCWAAGWLRPARTCALARWGSLRIPSLPDIHGIAVGALMLAWCAAAGFSVAALYLAREASWSRPAGRRVDRAAHPRTHRPRGGGRSALVLVKKK